jgi:pimeloyl-[acyl-carrier protein] methyl ester esterase
LHQNEEMMSLYSITSGEGPDLVLVHGWGLHGGIWDGFVPLLEPYYRVTRVDLPGHGNSAWTGETGLDAMAEAVLSAMPRQAALAGWSLGGMIALHAALLAPGRVTAWIGIASSPCFMRRPDWQSAMLPEMLDVFVADLERDYRGTLNRFLSLQVRGSENATQALQTLRTNLLARGEPDREGLRAGLEILRTADLRGELEHLHCPALLLMGERDTLVPAGAGHASVRLLPGARLEVVEGTGHAPFISAPRPVADIMHDFLRAAMPEAS